MSVHRLGPEWDTTPSSTAATADTDQAVAAITDAITGAPPARVAQLLLNFATLLACPDEYVEEKMAILDSEPVIVLALKACRWLSERETARYNQQEGAQ